MNTENILGINVTIANYVTIIQHINENIKNNEKKTIVAINPEKILMSKKAKMIKSIDSFSYKIADGGGIILASKIKKGNIKSRITGIDLMMNICDSCEKNYYSVFLYGAKESVLHKAIVNLQEQFPNLNISGYLNGYDYSEKYIIKKINEVKPNVIFVALGSLKQEKWILKNKEKLNTNILQGVGGSLDVISGELKRAPDLFQRLGLEWFYRLLQEPKRIFRQLKIIKFIFLILIERKKA